MKFGVLPVIDRSSDLQALNTSYSPSLPNSNEPVRGLRLSFLLTAAGQFRILTGFPLGLTFRPIDNVPESNTNQMK